MQARNPRKILGWYLCLLACYQLVYAARLAIPSVQNPSPLLNPRLGLEWVIANALSLEYRGVIVMLAAAGIVLLVLGIGILAGHQLWVKLYVVVEVLLSLPSIYFIGLLLIFGGGHILSRDDLPLLLFVFTLSTIIPLVLAIKSLKQAKTLNLNIDAVLSPSNAAERES